MAQKGDTTAKEMSEPAGKLMATVFWDFEGIILIYYTKRGSTISGEYCPTMLEKLEENRQKVCCSRQCAGSQSRVSMAILQTHGFESLVHPPYSPDLAPCDFYWFSNFK
ncbi:jg6054 [Pararge aegeria aegeria]|uniref:Jg6054 protein n=1 Tax=Pararge aegeria aegeria TaxID=348720 RepID=A0A8S4SIW6_9NEOP|nr:jg6054 [Pararge aegeria aegeria]